MESERQQSKIVERKKYGEMALKISWKKEKIKHSYTKANDKLVRFDSEQLSRQKSKYAWLYSNECALQAYPLSDHEQELPGERASFNFKVPGKIFDKNKDKNFHVIENNNCFNFYCSVYNISGISPIKTLSRHNPRQVIVKNKC